MRTITQLNLAALPLFALILTGCQVSPQPQTRPSTPTIETTPNSSGSAHLESISPVNQFTLQGKIGVKTPQQSGSAFFTWVQNHDEFDIQLSGILGIGKTQIVSRSGEVTLNSAKTGEISAPTPEALLLQATGWQAPILYLVDWVQARPATPASNIQSDSFGRPIQINEDGWEVTLSYENSNTLPNKLILKQLLATGQENRITMIIQNRE